MDYNSCLIHDAISKEWLLFQNPIKVYETYEQQNVIQFLEKIEKETSKGNYAVGFLSFEASPAFDFSLSIQQSNNFPLLWFGIYSMVSILPRKTNRHERSTESILWKPSVSKEEYKKNIKKIQNYIQQGDIYQANYTFFLQSKLNIQEIQFFLSNKFIPKLEEYSYSAVISTKNWDIYSASPELLFQKNGNYVISTPMKGTSPRGLWFEQDRKFRDILQNSEKQQAENLMIVDMVRNDLGKIAKWGTVQVEELFKLKSYPNQWQMISKVSCLSDANLIDIFRAMFPPASITGAPKKRAMEVIQEIEKLPRKIYTGSIGFITPNNKAQFNVAIRTLVIDKKNKIMEYGTGSGIIWDSKIETEWQECFNKTKVLTQTQENFDLIETLLWEPENNFFLLEAHLKRVLNSAAYFSINISFDNILASLHNAVKNLHIESRIRLIISRKGKIKIISSPINFLNKIRYVSLSKDVINSQCQFLYHKTTNRKAYEKALTESNGIDDVIFWNEKDEITESSIANIAIKINGKLITPPISCGLLPGVYRASLLTEGNLKEKIITKNELLKNNHKIYLLNSVRKLWKVHLRV